MILNVLTFWFMLIMYKNSLYIFWFMLIIFLSVTIVYYSENIYCLRSKNRQRSIYK